MQIKPPWRPDLLSCHFNPKFTTLSVENELTNMGLSDWRPSFFYEKVVGWPGSKSVYKLKYVGNIDYEPSHLKETCFIKEFDFTNLPIPEAELMRELKWFQDSEIYDQETVRFSSKLPSKRLEEILSSNDVAIEGDLYSPTFDDENYQHGHSKYSSSTHHSSVRKPYAKFSSSMLNNESLRGESGYTNNSDNA